MNKKMTLLIVAVLLTFIVQPVFALEIVIDPGHDGNEQNRGGPAFTVDDIGSTLPEQEFEGQDQIEVMSADVFSRDTEPYDYSTISLGMDTYTVQSVDYANNILTLSTPLSQDYPAGTSVTVEDFLVQVMGRRTDGSEPENWDPTAEYYDTLTYSHELPASEWGNWIPKEDDDNDPLGKRKERHGEWGRHRASERVRIIGEKHKCYA